VRTETHIQIEGTHHLRVRVRGDTQMHIQKMYHLSEDQGRNTNIESANHLSEGEGSCTEFLVFLMFHEFLGFIGFSEFLGLIGFPEFLRFLEFPEFFEFLGFSEFLGSSEFLRGVPYSRNQECTLVSRESQGQLQRKMHPHLQKLSSFPMGDVRFP
jgi:hypothetical protein